MGRLRLAGGLQHFCVRPQQIARRRSDRLRAHLLPGIGGIRERLSKQFPVNIPGHSIIGVAVRGGGIGGAVIREIVKQPLERVGCENKFREFCPVLQVCRLQCGKALNINQVTAFVF